MRTALLLSGQPRTMEFCYPSQKEHILDVYHPDVFICSDEQEDRLRELYNPVSIEVKDQQYVNQQVGLHRAIYETDGYEMPIIDLSCGWKVYRSNLLKQEHEKRMGFEYDVVLHSRFDVKFKKIQPIEDVQPDTLYVPRIGGYWITPPDEPGIHWKGYSTHLCWMTSKVSDQIAGISFEGPNNYKISCDSQTEYGYYPEYVLKNFLDRNHIRAELVEIDMMLIRGTCEAPLSFCNTSLDGYKEYK